MKNPTRLERLHVRLTIEELARLSDMARKQGLTASELIRREVFGDASGYMSYRPTPPTQDHSNE